jgi:hypothetical protein
MCAQELELPFLVLPEFTGLVALAKLWARKLSKRGFGTEDMLWESYDGMGFMRTVPDALTTSLMIETIVHVAKQLTLSVIARIVS